MMTFLPFLLEMVPEGAHMGLLEMLEEYFSSCAKILDRKRASTQRCEAKHVLDIILGRDTSSTWKKHPITPMWSVYNTPFFFPPNVILAFEDDEC